MPKISDKQMKMLLTFQQGELDAAVMYQKIASRIKNPAVAEEIKEIGKDEGRHAAVIFRLTQKKLKPKKALSNITLCGLKVIGAKLLFFIIAKFEQAAFKMYAPYANDFPELKAIGEDEAKHGNKIKELTKLL